MTKVPKQITASTKVRNLSMRLRAGAKKAYETDTKAANIKILVNLGPVYTSPGWIQPAAESQPFSSQISSSVYTNPVASRVSPPGRVTILEGRVNPLRLVRFL